MKTTGSFTTLVFLLLPLPSIADRSLAEPTPSLRVTDARQSVLLVPLPCGLSFAQSKRHQARLLDKGRAEVQWRAKGRAYRVEMRFVCRDDGFDALAGEAGLRLEAGKWVSEVVPPGSVQAIEVDTWQGVARESYQGVVCQAVVGKAKAGTSAFFVDMCVPEDAYRAEPTALGMLARQLSLVR